MADNPDLQNPHISGFLRRNHIAVLATASPQSAEPHAAVVYYATDSHMNIYFVTKENTTKSRNLTANPQAAIVVYESDSQRTAQISGQVERVNDKDMMERALKLMSKFSSQTAGTEQTPISRLDAGKYILYRISPQAVRLAEYRYGTKDEMFDVAVPDEESLDP